MDDDVRRRILSRRARLVAAALAASAAAASCGGASVLTDAGPDGAQPCLSMDATFDGPQVCLSAPYDSGPDVQQPDDGASDVSTDAPEDG